MPTETELRELFRGAGAPGSTIDTAAIIRRSKRRRLPAQFGVGSVTTLAVAGIGIAGFSGLRQLAPTSTAGSAVDSPAETFTGQSDGQKLLDEDFGSRALAEKLNLCGAPVAEIAPSTTGLELATHFPATAPATGEPVNGTVTVTNTGTETISGTTAASPAITVSRDGVTLWHSNGPMVMLAVIVDLGPGESMEYQATFTPVRCDVEDDLAEGFRADLPALEPGSYQVSAAIDLMRENTPAEMVTGAASTVRVQ